MNVQDFIPGWLKTFVTEVSAKLNWKTSHVIADQDREEILALLKPSYYIILTRHSGFFSSYVICFSHWVLSGFKHWGYYAHALMNLEDDAHNPDDFKLVEATTKFGVKFSTFDHVFDPQCSGVALLKPKCLEIEEWTAIMDRATMQIGKPYDSLFDLASDQSLSCVELVRTALMALPTYETDFANFEHMIQHRKNLTPHMFYECSDFEVVWEVRR